MEDIIALVLIFGSPVAFAGMFFAYRMKKLQLQSGSGVDAAKLQQLEAASRELRARIETLESIVIENDTRAGGLRASRAIDELQVQQHDAVAPVSR